MEKTVAIVDIDGVIAKIENDIVFDKMVEQFGLNPNCRPQYLDYFYSFEEHAPEIITRDFVYKFAYEKMSFLREKDILPQEFLYYVDYFTARLGPKDGAKEMLEYFKQRNMTTYALSNWLYDNQVLKLGIFGFLEYFEKIYAIDGIERYKKPHQRALYKVFLQHRREQCVIIGDSLNTDIRCANNAGIDSIWFNERGLIAPEDNKPTYETDKLIDVKRYIK